MGDFNVNLLNENIRFPASDFINTFSSYSLYPSITKHTRITTNPQLKLTISLQTHTQNRNLESYCMT